MKKLTYGEVKKIFEDSDCELLSNTYINSKFKLNFIAKYGHEDSCTYQCFRKRDTKRCLRCVNRNNASKTHITQNVPNGFKNLLEKNLLKQIKYKVISRFDSDTFFSIHIKCNTCKEKKPLYLFTNVPANTGRYGKDSYCKKCGNNHNAFRRNHHSIKQFIKYLLNSSKHKAIERGKKGRKKCSEFSLTIQDILDLKETQNNKCYFTGIELEWKYNSLNKVSIDRIDNDKGYTKDNIRLLVWHVNQAQSNLTDNRFRELVYKIVLKDMNESKCSIDDLINNLSVSEKKL